MGMEKNKWTSSVFDSVKGKQFILPFEDFEKRLLQSIEAAGIIPQSHIIKLNWLMVAACAITILISANILALGNWKSKNDDQVSISDTQKKATADNLIPNYDFFNESL